MIATHSNSSAAMPRKMPVSRPMEKPIVATNRPMATNEAARPAASAAGPNLCSETAAPSTSGNSGRTHGDRVDSTPARNANRIAPVAMMPSSVGRAGSYQRGNRDRVGIAHRSGRLGLAPERDQGALALRAELANDRPLTVEIDREGDEVVVLRPRDEGIDDRLLSFASRAPRRRKVNANACSAALRRRKAIGVERLAFRRIRDRRR